MVSLFLSPSLHLLLSMSLDIQQHHGNSTGSGMSDLSPGQRDFLKSRNLKKKKSDKSDVLGVAETFSESE